MCAAVAIVFSNKTVKKEKEGTKDKLRWLSSGL
jgi:hypothetical protein